MELIMDLIMDLLDVQCSKIPRSENLPLVIQPA